jgi:hypothetical protein
VMSYPPIEPNSLFESILTFENNFESSRITLKTDEERAVSNLESTPKESTRSKTVLFAVELRP